MKRKLFFGALLLEAALCLLLALTQTAASDTSLFAFPFAHLGSVLRQLSLSGSMGNLAAWLLYVVLSLSPFLLFLSRSPKSPEHILIPLMSIVLFIVLYYMINPSHLGENFIHSQPLSTAILAAPVWSLLLAYGILRLRRRLIRSDSMNLLSILTMLLSALAIILVAIIFLSEPASLLADIHSLEATNTALSAQDLLPSRIFLVLRSLVGILPYGLDMLILYFAQKLLDAFTSDPYGQSTVEASRKLAQICGHSLAATALAHSILQILQLCFIGELYTLDAVIQIPLVSLIFMTAVLLLSRFIEKSRALKQENDSFI